MNKIIQKISFTLFIFLVNSCTTMQNTMKRKCHTFILTPPFHTDETISDQIIEEWVQEKKIKFKKCDKIINRTISKELFSLLNIDYKTKIKRNNLGNQQIERIIEKTKATRLVMLSSKIKKNKLLIKSQIYNLIPFKILRKSKLAKTFKSKISSKTLKKLKNSTAVKAFSFIPNTFTLNILDRDISSSFKSDKYYVKNSKNHNLFPRFVSAFSLTNVIHPFGFNLFDISFNRYFALSFNALDMTVNLQEKNDDGEDINDPIIYKFKHYSFSPTFNGEMALYSLIGTTFIHIGFGGTVYNHSDSLNNDKSGIIFTVDFGLGHRFFLSDRFFMQFSLSTLSLDKPIIDNEFFKFNSVGTVFFGFGYYFPEGRTYLRNAFK